MHSDIHGPCWFKLDGMIGTTELFILILVDVILALNQGKNFCLNYLSKFPIGLNGIANAV